MGLRKLKIISDHKKKGIISCIEEVLRQHEDILFALLYGSFVEHGVTEGYGDIDIAIYSSLPEEKDSAIEARLESEIIEGLLNNDLNLLPVEVINLKKAPYHLRVSLLGKPYIILKKNEDIFANFIEETSKEAMINNHFRRESMREVLESGKCQK